MLAANRFIEGNSVVVAHHDTLTIERRFSRHSAEVQLLAVDTQSATMGNGRFAVSYDVDMTAIVWDLMTGEEVARFASYENLTCAAWMRNGNVAFGMLFVMGFSRSRSADFNTRQRARKRYSLRTYDLRAHICAHHRSDPYNGTGPRCRLQNLCHWVIRDVLSCNTPLLTRSRYQNGSLIIATLQPRFTILHSLSTSRAPSPIVNLAWHASSSRQKSDMLAVQTEDGDLRVWSVAKSFNSNDPAKVVRILKRNDNYQNSPNWMGWSKNGRIIQFSDK